MARALSLRVYLVLDFSSYTGELMVTFDAGMTLRESLNNKYDSFN